MKFHLVPIGARFSYRGETYHKTSPLAASKEGGGQRAVARSAEVELVDGPQAPPAGEPSSPLKRALDSHQARCRDLLGQAAGDMPEVGRLALLKALDDSYRELLRALD